MREQVDIWVRREPRDRLWLCMDEAQPCGLCRVKGIFVTRGRGTPSGRSCRRLLVVGLQTRVCEYTRRGG